MKKIDYYTVMTVTSDGVHEERFENYYDALDHYGKLEFTEEIESMEVGFVHNGIYVGVSNMDKYHDVRSYIRADELVMLFENINNVEVIGVKEVPQNDFNFETLDRTPTLIVDTVDSWYHLCLDVFGQITWY